MYSIQLIPVARLIGQMPYRQRPKGRQFEESEIQKMLTSGAVQPSISEWAPLVVLAPKNNCSLCFCENYCRLNALTRKNVYPVPSVAESTEKSCEARIFELSMPLSGFWQAPLFEKERLKTEFSSHERLHECTRMLFGLNNAPSTFQRAPGISLARYK